MRYPWPEGKQSAAVLSFDFDAESGFLFREPEKAKRSLGDLEERRFGPRVGVDPARVTFRRDLSTPDAIAAFRAGQGDFIEHGPPVIDQLVADGTGHLVASMGEATGPVPFSSFMATPEMLTKQRDVLIRFVRGLYRAQRWMAASTAQEIAAVVAPVFGDIDPAIRVAAVERYLKQSTWARDPVLTRTGYDTLQEILLSAGFIKKPHPFDALVDTDIARAAVGY